MTEQELDKFFINQEFRSVRVNVEGIRVYYRQAGEACKILILYSLPGREMVARPQQENIGRQIREKFEQAGFARLEVLNLVLTQNPAAVDGVFGDRDKFWILDAAAGQVMLYEDQEGDFCGLRRPLEDLLLEKAEGKFWNAPKEALRQAGDLKSNLSLWNTIIVVINLAVFLLCEWKGSTEDTRFLLEHGALCAENVTEGREYYRLLTHMFLHSGIQHLVNNMLILLFIGNRLERMIGHIRYLVIYFCSGLLAGIVSMSYNRIIGEYAVSVGASGAVFGVVGALAYIILANRGKAEDLTKRQIFIFIILSLYGGFIRQGIDNAAHIGGLAAGFLLALLLYRRPKGGNAPKGQKRGRFEG